MKTGVIYARYSSDSQTEQSIEGQLRVCQQYAANNDIIIVGTYVDRAMTGTNDLRPDFQRMIKDSYKKQWDVVLVYKLDRFSRNRYEMVVHKKTLTDNGVKLVSAMENIPETPEGIILESLLEGMNAYYSAELSQKVLRGLKESYIKGNWTGGPVIYGYGVNRETKKLYIDEDEAEIVREIFSKIAKGTTGVDIANNLKERGVRTKKGIFITEKAIYKMIANTKYVGKIEHQGVVYTNIYPAIVDEITWQRVQEIRADNQHAPGRKKDIFEFILSGRLVCGDCQTMMVGESGTSHTGDKHYYYNCLGRRRKKSTCKFKAINKFDLEDAVMRTTWELLCEEETISALAAEILKKHENTNKQNIVIKALQQKRDNALKASNNLISAIEQGIITEQTKIRLKELENQIAQLDFDIEQEKKRTYSFLTQKSIEDYLRGIICGNIDDISVRKKIVKTFIREVLLFNDKALIVYNFTDITFCKDDIYQELAEIQQKPEIKEALKGNGGSYKLTSAPPRETQLNHNGLVGFFMLKIR